ncbi:MAG: DNA topoisomerase I [Candidatus Aminicenantes bacterium RBG_16_63_16]|nr:MAG: DNA topoisomerase I [Candidatus Aminicenantes bacterium RBG_16_63_16]
MQKSLVIVESPAKAHTINRYLGPRYVVKASMGHIRDLPKSKLGVDLEHDFTPTYVVIPERKKTVAELQKIAKDSAAVILAADPDREGEAISWHLSQLLEPANPNIRRAVFHEITKPAVEEAFEHLGTLDENMFKAQQTRRILDRLVGYQISPLLWKKIGKGLSAGRVQSIALRLICEREKAIRAFKSEEYWSVTAQLEASEPPPFNANLVKLDGKKFRVAEGARAQQLVDGLKEKPFILEDVTVREKKRHPGPPYITSTLQQESFRVLGFPVKKTMFLAQKLYEGMPIGERGLVGLITYMRTDSVRISEGAQAGARKYIHDTYSAAYVPAHAHVYKNKKKSQDAHEAIRPTSLDLPPEAVKPFLRKEELDVYTLIWNKFIASQMSPAVVEETEFTILADRCEFKAKGEVIRFNGYFVVYPNLDKETVQLPKAQKGETLKLLGLETKQNFTQPPPRYTEGSLVKELEAKGIGRPSTYAPIITTLQDRVYVIKEKGKFVPTELGMFVTDFLVANFTDLMEVKFTALMEEELDRISDGEEDWLIALRRYHDLLSQDLVKAGEAKSVRGEGIPVDEKCPECGKPLVIRTGRFGQFKACSGYPECKYKQSLTKPEATPLEEKCPTCGAQLVRRRGRYGLFVACSTYPACKYIQKKATEKVETGIACPLGCGGMLLKRTTRRGKFFYGCGRFPKCRFASWDEPLSRACPKCAKPVLFRKRQKGGTSLLYCPDEKCGYKETEATEGVGSEGPEKPPDAGKDEARP